MREKHRAYAGEIDDVVGKGKIALVLTVGRGKKRYAELAKG
jgi:hypothetical protein